MRRKLASLEQQAGVRAFATELSLDNRAELAAVVSEMVTLNELFKADRPVGAVQKLILAIKELKQLAHKTRLFVEQEDSDGWGPLVGYAATP